jgi:hypothetical protein
MNAITCVGFRAPSTVDNVIITRRDSSLSLSANVTATQFPPPDLTPVLGSFMDRKDHHRIPIPATIPA